MGKIDPFTEIILLYRDHFTTLPIKLEKNQNTGSEELKTHKFNLIECIPGNDFMREVNSFSSNFLKLLADNKEADLYYPKL